MSGGTKSEEGGDDRAKTITELPAVAPKEHSTELEMPAVDKPREPVTEPNLPAVEPERTSLPLARGAEGATAIDRPRVRRTATSP